MESQLSGGELSVQLLSQKLWVKFLRFGREKVNMNYSHFAFFSVGRAESATSTNMLG